jgi:hypothetical protein
VDVSIVAKKKKCLHTGMLPHKNERINSRDRLLIQGKTLFGPILLELWNLALEFPV